MTSAETDGEYLTDARFDICNHNGNCANAPSTDALAIVKLQGLAQLLPSLAERVNRPYVNVDHLESVPDRYRPRTWSKLDAQDVAQPLRGILLEVKGVEPTLYDSRSKFQRKGTKSLQRLPFDLGHLLAGGFHLLAMRFVGCPRGSLANLALWTSFQTQFQMQGK